MSGTYLSSNTSTGTFGNRTGLSSLRYKPPNWLEVSIQPGVLSDSPSWYEVHSVHVNCTAVGNTTMVFQLNSHHKWSNQSLKMMRLSAVALFRLVHPPPMVVGYDMSPLSSPYVTRCPCPSLLLSWSSRFLCQIVPRLSGTRCVHCGRDVPTIHFLAII